MSLKEYVRVVEANRVETTCLCREGTSGPLTIFQTLVDRVSPGTAASSLVICCVHPGAGLPQTSEAGYSVT